MPKVEFVGQSKRDEDNAGATSSRLVNCYREAVGERSGFVLKPVLGMSAFGTTSDVLTRAMHRAEDWIYAAVGGNLHRVASNGDTVSLASITDDVDTSISSNNGNICVVSGGEYKVWDGTTLNTPTAGAFSDFGSVEFLGQRTILTERNGRRFQWSNVADPETLDGLNFATAESRDDDILRAVAFADVLWLFKERSIERWYQTGLSGADALRPQTGATIDVGLKGYNLVCKAPATMAMVGSDNKFYLIGPGGVQVISTTGVETAIKQKTPTHCFYYEDEGHSFLVLRFSDRPAWVFDLSLKEWHERAEGLDLDQWNALACAEIDDKFIVGTVGGDFLRLARTQLDQGVPLICQATGRTLRLDGKRFRIPAFELLTRVGVSTEARYEVLNVLTGTVEVVEEAGGGLVVDAKTNEELAGNITLEMSKDFGKTWTAPKQRSMGALGDYDHRVIWRALGQFRQATPRITWSDVTDTPVDAEGVVEIA